MNQIAQLSYIARNETASSATSARLARPTSP